MADWPLLGASCAPCVNDFSSSPTGCRAGRLSIHPASSLQPPWLFPVSAQGPYHVGAERGLRKPSPFCCFIRLGCLRSPNRYTGQEPPALSGSLPCWSLVLTFTSLLLCLFPPRTVSRVAVLPKWRSYLVCMMRALCDQVSSKLMREKGIEQILPRDDFPCPKFCLQNPICLAAS